MRISNQENWTKWVEGNTDPYGSAVIRYAKAWANILEVWIDELGVDEAMRLHADKTSHQADTEGITGFMYGAAVSVLAQCWQYGDDLRRWHNLKTQIRDEGERANDSGGVLNPALLNIGRGEVES